MSAAFSSLAQVLVNGGFEQGFPGWAGTYGFMDSTNAFEGSRVGILVDISHSSVGKCLNQRIPTTLGQQYSIEFALKLPDLFEIFPGEWVPVVGNSNGGSTVISVRWDDLTLADIPVVNRDDWAVYTLSAVATSSSSALTFFNPSSAAWPFVDGITVTPVPEPASITVAAASALALCFLMHKLQGQLQHSARHTLHHEGQTRILPQLQSLRRVI